MAGFVSRNESSDRLLGRTLVLASNIKGAVKLAHAAGQECTTRAAMFSECVNP